MTFPIPEDTAYYWGVARNLAEGRGFVSDTIWSYATPARDSLSGGFGFFFPRAAFEIWLPLPSLLGLVPMLAGGTTGYTTTLPVAAILGALVPVVAWRIGADVAEERGLGPERVPNAGGRRRPGGRGRAAVRPRLAPPRLVEPVRPAGPPRLPVDGPAPASPADRAPSTRRLIGLGIVIGVAGLARNEAAWVGAAWAIVAVGAYRAGGARAVVTAIAVPGLIAVAVMSPWLARNWVDVRHAPARPGDHERLGDHGHRDLRLAAPGHGRATTWRWARPPGSSTASTASPTTS